MYSQYEQLKPRPRKGHLRRRRLFRTARLNALGWAALTGWVVVWAAVLGVAAGVTGLSPSAGGVLGTAVGLAAVLIFDRRRWGRMETYFAWTDDPAVVRQAVQRLTDAGMAVSYYLSPDGEPSLVYRQRDQRRVMRELGFAAGA